MLEALPQTDLIQWGSEQRKQSGGELPNGNYTLTKGNFPTLPRRRRDMPRLREGSTKGDSPQPRRPHPTATGKGKGKTNKTKIAFLHPPPTLVVQEPCCSAPSALGNLKYSVQ